MASGSADNTIRLWDITDPAHPTPRGQPLAAHNYEVYTVAVGPDKHTLASGSADNTIRLWDITDPAHPTPIGPPVKAHTDAVFAIAYSPDGQWLASVGDTTVRLWTVTDRGLIPRGGPMSGHTAAVTAVAFAPDNGSVLTGGQDGTARFWTVDEEQAIQRICEATRNTLTAERWSELLADVTFTPACPPT